MLQWIIRNRETKMLREWSIWENMWPCLKTRSDKCKINMTKVRRVRCKMLKIKWKKWRKKKLKQSPNLQQINLIKLLNFSCCLKKNKNNLITFSKISTDWQLKLSKFTNSVSRFKPTSSSSKSMNSKFSTFRQPVTKRITKSWN